MSEASVARSGSITSIISGPPTASGASPAPPAAQRTRKTVMYKNKRLMICFPVDDERGKAGSSPWPLSPGEVEERLENWRRDGYDTRGFSYWGSTTKHLTTEGQSKFIYPDPTEIRDERMVGSYKVSIPDRKGM
jgi:hypothetical protein